MRPVKPLKVKSFETKMVWLPLDKEEFSLKKFFFSNSFQSYDLILDRYSFEFLLITVEIFFLIYKQCLCSKTGFSAALLCQNYPLTLRVIKSQ